MTTEALAQLFEQNVQQLNQLQIDAGSLVKGLLLELQRKDRNTYIRLRNPAPGGYTIDYDVVEGDRSLVGRLAGALGFKSVTESSLEVFSD